MKLSVASAVAIVVMCCIHSACDDADVAVPEDRPSAFGRDGIPLHCPSVSRFSVPFILNITAGTSPLTLSEVRFQPTNPFGRTSPPTIFDSASLTRRFGSVTIASFAVGQFPFTRDFSCDMTGSMLDVSVTTTDGAGMNRVSTVPVPVY